MQTGKIKTKKALIIPDVHAPYHDQKAYDIMLQIGKAYNPDEIILMGDFGDFYAVQSYCKEPNIEGLLIKEVREVRDMLKELSQLFKKSKLIYIEGNHEDRLRRYISQKAPELFGLVGVEDLLCLKEYGYKFIKYEPAQKHHICGSTLIARHEPSTGGVNAARGTILKSLCSVVYAHTHRKDESNIISLNGKNFRSFCPGWIGDKNNGVFTYVKGHHQWTQGFALVDVLSNRDFHHNIIDIIDHKAMFNDKIYK